MNMKADTIHTIYFLGIGGIGMSALARYFKAIGKTVSGYDRTETELTRALVQEGIPVHYTEAPVPPEAYPDLVVYTPAIPVDHAEYQYFLTHSIPMLKRSEVLAMLANDLYTIAVAGTHGKTSISCMITHLLKHNGLPVNGFIGGISVNYQTNLLLTPGATQAVVEADEYDRSFLALHPDIAVISAVDADHLDIYKTHDALKAAFAEFAGQLRPAGTLVIRAGLHIHPAEGRAVRTYGAPEADYRATNVRVEQGAFVFDLTGPALKVDAIRMQVPGNHNIENALAAAAVADISGLSGDQIRSGLESYQGVKRRFECVVCTAKTVYIDDYAHHPEEIRACISTARLLYPGRRITGIFQPHLFSRTRDFAEGFSAVLSMFDVVALLPVYPARELPIPGVTSEMLLDRIQGPEKVLLQASEVESWIRKTDPEVLITIGAGDIDRLVPIIKTVLKPLTPPANE